MKDIEKAVIAEQQYINDKLNGQTVNLMDYIGNHGYETEEEFRIDKNDWLLKELNVTERPVSDYEIKNESIKLSNEIMKLQKPYLLWNIEMEGLCAFIPMNFVNFDKLEEYNIKPIPQGYVTSPNGGVIITGNNDLKFAIIYPTNQGYISDLFFTKLRDYLRRFFSSVEIDNNDIMINGKKVIGVGLRTYNDMFINFYNISFNDYAEIIKEICGKSIKEPGYIDINIISPNTLLNEILQWLQQL